MFTKESILEGEVICIDKPLEWSSFHAVNAVRWALRKAFSLKKLKVGHAGTLDPLATGLLVLCTGKATKKIAAIQDASKTYEGTMVLGATTRSYDLETEVDQTYSIDHVTPELIAEKAALFQGDLLQKPPIFSAIRKGGKRLYEYAREGETVKLPERNITIEAFKIDRIDLPEVAFTVRCGKGTYIRSLVHDLGQALGCGAYLSALRRTKIGVYNVDNALSPEAFKAQLRAKEENKG